MEVFKIKKLFIVVGNGFSIDLIKKIGKEEEIDVINLFSKGAEVPWPKTQDIGFLSYKYCSSLWTLGARTTTNKEDCLKLIEDIITCINVFNYSKQSNSTNQNKDSIFIKAYGELTTYLRYLFIHYNSKISDDDLKIKDIPLIEYIKKELPNYDEIHIINYNYDVLLERLLIIKGIDFNIEGFETKNTKIKIYKPHGSISFSFDIKINPTEKFTIRTSELDSITQNTNNFKIIYDFKDDYPIVNAIIPPAGDSNRTHMGWIKTIRDKIIENLRKSTNYDKLIMFGISYWHVDRAEIDEILTNINSSIETIMVNPSPPTALDAVLMSIFESYIHFKNSDLLLGRV